jgi:hypothetical protein
MCYLTSGLFTTNEMEAGMNRRIWIVIGLAALAAGICGGGALLDGSAAPHPLNVQHNDSSDLEDLIGLGDGAYADWVASGNDSLDAAGHSPVSEVLLHGRADEDMVVRVTAKALIGALTRVLVEEDVAVAAGEEVVVPVDVAAALDMHERQYAYPTRIRVYTAVVLPSGKLGKGQSIGQRFFVARAGGGHEIHDFDSFAARYPRGVTDPAELARMEEFIRDQPPDPDGATDGFIHSAVRLTVLDGADGNAPDAEGGAS